jgi:hypothetical protein
MLRAGSMLAIFNVKEIIHTQSADTGLFITQSLIKFNVPTTHKLPRKGKLNVMQHFGNVLHLTTVLPVMSAMSVLLS